jgi:hypothetical protein
VTTSEKRYANYVNQQSVRLLDVLEREDTK